ncbi:MAG: glycosyltransferase family 9 protein [Proteobacteria bacterium]|nr:glycosyltransferase family 9 protein [Pseudomonadota bacterium]
MSVNQILVIRFSSLGDIILLTPIFREIKRIFPDARIDLLTSTTFRDVCQNNPYIDQIIALERKGKGGEFKSIVSNAKKKKYDLIFDAHQSIRSRLFLKNTFGWMGDGSRKIYRIDKRSWQRNLLLIFKINKLEKYISQREAYCQLLSDFKEFKQIDSSTELYPHHSDEATVTDIIQKNDLEGSSLIGIAPGASFAGKCWSKENYLELIRKLESRKLKTVLLGGKEDIEPSWIFQNSSAKPLNLAGELTFLESAALLKRCDIVISNDSAIVHLAEAIKTPAISIFGPTVKEFGYAPFLPHSRLIEIDLPCRPCSRNGKGECKNHILRQCLKEITVESVFQAVVNMR